MERASEGRRRSAIVALMTGVVLIANVGIAGAVVTRLDPAETGADWFVGKGDLQAAFGWTAKDTDSRVGEVGFTYRNVETRTYDCVATYQYRSTRTSTTVDVMTSVNGTTRVTAYETRTSGRKTTTSITGVFVTLSGTPIVDDDPGSCPASWTDVDNVLGGGAGVTYVPTKDNSSMVRSVTEELVATSGGGRKATTAVIWTHEGDA